MVALRSAVVGGGVIFRANTPTHVNAHKISKHTHTHTTHTHMHAHARTVVKSASILDRKSRASVHIIACENIGRAVNQQRIVIPDDQPPHHTHTVCDATDSRTDMSARCEKWNSGVRSFRVVCHLPRRLEIGGGGYHSDAGEVASRFLPVADPTPYLRPPLSTRPRPINGSTASDTCGCACVRVKAKQLAGMGVPFIANTLNITRTATSLTVYNLKPTPGDK